MRPAFADRSCPYCEIAIPEVSLLLFAEHGEAVQLGYSVGVVLEYLESNDEELEQT